MVTTDSPSPRPESRTAAPPERRAGWLAMQASSLVSAIINIVIMLHFGETAKPILRRHM